MVNPISMTTVKITAFRCFRDGSCIGDASASGFFWKSAGQYFLITNWHNVTGRNHLLGTYIGSFAPSHFRISFFGKPVALGERKEGIPYRTREVALFDTEERSVWIEHPAGMGVDVVALPVPGEIYSGIGITALNELEFVDIWSPSVCDDCFIAGYPEGVTGPKQTPIFKKASFATEPSLNSRTSEPYLVDTLGNVGLSGSPVIARKSGWLFTGNDGKPSANDMIGTWEKFVGIYSGRVGDVGLGFQLGRVFRPDTIDEILNCVR